ncbi:MAG: hydrogenase 4 subunit F [Cyanobacteria bacterium NC_groundwater_1444_Ag_S-0.65um_54_12]|nr:hydrogenase 4 subunit F [Cyanobacteria bacterium NC_groundwater_1444_Ag_S-0.65um_54_12]
MNSSLLLWGMLILPAIGAAWVLLPGLSVQTILKLLVAGVLAVSALGMPLIWQVFAAGPVQLVDGWLFLDALSAYHLVVLLVVFSLSSLFAMRYFGFEYRSGIFDALQARKLAALWFGTLAAMVLVLISGNLGLMWVGIEATTLLTAFLICVHLTPVALEAMWKYLLICSVGVAFAFMGTILVASCGRAAGLGDTAALQWTRLMAVAPRLDPATLKMGFLFLLVGYGTKVGLAPFHNWLPDAHSQAPAPVSALFSGFMLNAALYCLMRYVPLVEQSTGNAGWSRQLLVGFGILSILLAAAFIIFQHDVKRLLAYHSIEHMGIIALGIGLGGLGTFAALFHVFNHSICKSLGFFCAGRLGQLYQTHDMRSIVGALRTAPVWGGGLLGSLLALIGFAPFALFMSEFQIMQAAVASGAFWSLGLFVLGVGVVFVGALGHAITIAFGEPVSGIPAEAAGWLDRVIVYLPLSALLLLGVWMPGFVIKALEQAAHVLGTAL